MLHFSYTKRVLIEEDMSARQEQLMQAHKTVEQLRTQANLERAKVSVSSKR